MDGILHQERVRGASSPDIRGVERDALVADAVVACRLNAIVAVLAEAQAEDKEEECDEEDDKGCTSDLRGGSISTQSESSGCECGIDAQQVRMNEQIMGRQLYEARRGGWVADAASLPGCYRWDCQTCTKAR
jgi:hypothetical protein